MGLMRVFTLNQEKVQKVQDQPPKQGIQKNFLRSATRHTHRDNSQNTTIKPNPLSPSVARTSFATTFRKPKLTTESRVLPAQATHSEALDNIVHPSRNRELQRAAYADQTSHPFIRFKLKRRLYKDTTS